MALDLEKILNSDLSYGTKYAVLHEITWIWTEFNGKYLGCKYWSQAALECYNDYKNKQGVIPYGKLFTHDHSIPRKIILDWFLKNTKELSKEDIMKILDNCLVGVVITKDEDKIKLKELKQDMPNSIKSKSLDQYSENDKWERYNNAEMNIIRVKWNGRKFIKEENMNLREQKLQDRSK